MGSYPGLGLPKLSLIRLGLDISLLCQLCVFPHYVFFSYVLHFFLCLISFCSVFSMRTCRAQHSAMSMSHNFCYHIDLNSVFPNIKIKTLENEVPVEIVLRNLSFSILIPSLACPLLKHLRKIIRIAIYLFPLLQWTSPVLRQNCGERAVGCG